MAHIDPILLNADFCGRDDQVVPFKRERAIGHMLCQSKGLEPSTIELVLEQQRRHGGRFGEVAVAQGLVTEEDVLEVLAGQFDYPYVRSFGDPAIDDELVCACDPLGEDATAFRELRTELLTGVLGTSQPRALAVLSPQRQDGRSYVAANLAVACAQLGGRVLLVDADMREPRQHALFRIDDSMGLSNLLAGRVSPDVVQQPSPLPGLFLIGAGVIPPNPLELVQRGAFAALVREWLAQFDYVVIDTPAANHGTEARVIAAMAGAALVVARPHAARMPELNRLVAAVGKGPAALAGVVMNEH